jgi:hypothetical protein
MNDMTLSEGIEIMQEMGMQTVVIDEHTKFDITSHHKDVSNIDTPNFFIKNKGGIDYVEYSYMREVADKHYPGWSWKIIKSELLGSEAYVVHGRLRWFDRGIWREADSVAAHRIQSRRDGGGFVDIGNDIKAANTDAIKKAFNMYLNIADDVYRNRVEDVTLTEDDIESIRNEMIGLDKKWYDKIEGSIERGEIEKPDINRIIARIQTIKEEGENSE